MSKFKILWIDDQPQKIELEKVNIEEIIKQKGFTPKIEIISKINHSEITSQTDWFKKLKSREFDLLFIDFNLCNHILGSQIISEIRKNNNIYVDIIFYSSDRDKLISAIKDSFDNSLLDFIDDVHVAILDDLDFYEKVENIIDKIISSWYNAHSIRGVILARTSKFELLVNDIIRLYYSSEKDFLKYKLLAKKQNVIEQVAQKWNRLENEDDPSLYVIEHPVYFNWNTRKMMFDILIENGAIKLQDNDFSKKMDMIFTLRNDFAHNRAKIEDGKITLHKNGKTIIYDEQKIKHLRNDINSIENVLEELISKHQA
jgi:hypothetical protein